MIVQKKIQIFILDTPYRLKMLLNSRLEWVIRFLSYSYSYKYIELCAVFKEDS